MEADEAAKDFKKPVFIAKSVRQAKSAASISEPTEPESAKPENTNLDEQAETTSTEVPLDSVQTNSVYEYQEPEWSGLAESSTTSYALEILKNGSIVETMNLMTKPFYVIGRFNNCDLNLQHPTISRFHAVLQYRNEFSDSQEKGFYIYDLGSTHGTFLNKMRIKPKIYAPVKVGHVLKFGCSTRMLILTGPEEDKERESEFTVTELKQKRNEELRKRDELIAEQEKQEELKRKQIEEAGIDWGMGEDADGEADLSENPFAQSNNEELYLDNPKTTLRGFFEREGLDLEYDCKEQGIGQFFCRVELPIDDDMGRPIFAEVLHKGKKKEVVIQCAMEACRILDRHGLLRQSTHESRKRKPKNWEENDYYDSDDDTYLDRTGSVEKKRDMRIKAKQPQKAETYDELVKRESLLIEQIKEVELKLAEVESESSVDLGEKSANEADSLDSFMLGLKDEQLDKTVLKKLRVDLNRLQQEHKNVVKLVNITKPISLPSLVPNLSVNQSKTVGSKGFPMFGKRKKIAVQVPVKKSPNVNVCNDFDDEDEEDCFVSNLGSKSVLKQPKAESETVVKCVPTNERFIQTIKSLINNKRFKSVKIKLIEVDHKLDSAISDGVDVLVFEGQQEEILGAIHNLENSDESEEVLTSGLATLVDNFLIDVKSAKPPIKIVAKVEKLVQKGQKEQKEVKRKETEVVSLKPGKSNSKKKKKNDNVGKEYQKDKDYEMWVPPIGQSGDGRTSLNEKLGY